MFFYLSSPFMKQDFPVPGAFHHKSKFLIFFWNVFFERVVPKMSAKVLSGASLSAEWPIHSQINA